MIRQRIQIDNSLDLSSPYEMFCHPGLPHFDRAVTILLSNINRRASEIEIERPLLSRRTV